MKLKVLVFLNLAFNIFESSCLKCFDCGVPNLMLVKSSNCFKSGTDCFGKNSTCIDLQLKDRSRNSDFVIKGCAATGVCESLGRKLSNFKELSCSQCSEDWCNDQHITKRVARAATLTPTKPKRGQTLKDLVKKVQNEQKESNKLTREKFEEIISQYKSLNESKNGGSALSFSLLLILVVQCISWLGIL